MSTATSAATIRAAHRRSELGDHTCLVDEDVQPRQLLGSPLDGILRPHPLADLGLDR
jgi:hypothetical protein